jgi:hypothetical protein
MPYIGTQPNDVKKNTGLYTPSEILQLEKDGHWGGSLELIEVLEPSGVNSIDTSVLPTHYDVIKVDFNIKVSTGAANVFHCRFYESGVLNTSGIYEYGILYNGSEVKSNTATSVYLGNFGNTGSGTQGYAYFYNLSDTNEYSYLTFHNYDNDNVYWIGGNSFPSASLVDKLQFKNSGASKTFSSGTQIKIYGIKEL